jgi:hypothetical protein
VVMLFGQQAIAFRGKREPARYRSE